MSTTSIHLFMLWAVVVSCASPGFANDAERRPNTVLIMCDDTGWSDIGCYGGEIRTPNLATLAKAGVRFRRFYNNAKCGASRVSLMMGRSNVRASQRSYSNPTLGQVLQRAGYNTYASGKRHSTTTLYGKGVDHYYGLRDRMCNHLNPRLQRKGEVIPASKKRVQCSVRIACTGVVFRQP